MVLPLLLGLAAGGAGLSLLGSIGGDTAGEIAKEVVEYSFAAMGSGLVAAGSGLVEGLKKEFKGKGVQVTATITVVAISYFFFKNYIQ